VSEQEKDISLKEDRAYYVKLHGSCDWKYKDCDERLMVLGGNKEQSVNKLWIIKKYFEIFETIVTKEINKLLIIGYGLMDHHVNNILLKACQRDDFKIYLISPEAPQDMAKRLHYFYENKYLPALNNSHVCRVADMLNRKKNKADVVVSNTWKIFEKINYHYPNSLLEIFYGGPNRTPEYNRIVSDLSFCHNL
jgi:hypothetical protein